MNKIEPYEWQNRLIRIYRGKGVVKAFAGTGKTYAAILLIKDKGYKNVVVSVPTRKLKSQWTEELKKNDLDFVRVQTFHILSKERSKGIECELLIVDECHRSASPVFKNIYENINYENILGLTATPNKACIEYCGGVIMEVPLKEAHISDFTVFFHSIDLNIQEKMFYDETSEAIGKLLGRMRRADNEKDKWHFRQQLDYMIFKRRSVVYLAEERIPKAVELLNQNKGRPTLVICKRIEQADEISKITGYPAYHSEQPNEKALDDFQNDRIPALISVGMLSEGYDKRNIQCLIIVSTAITEAYHIQSIGRAVRLPDDADIHILLARKTTDEKLLQFRHMYDHEIVGNFSVNALKPKNPWVEQFYLGDEYQVDIDGRIFQKTSEGKIYYKDNAISSTLQRFFNYRVGKFRVTNENLVIAKSGGKIRSLGMLTEPLEKIEYKKIKPLKKNKIKLNTLKKIDE
jgi:superfamily II DNA or RNA helicase